MLKHIATFSILELPSSVLSYTAHQMLVNALQRRHAEFVRIVPPPEKAYEWRIKLQELDAHIRNLQQQMEALENGLLRHVENLPV